METPQTNRSSEGPQAKRSEREGSEGKERDRKASSRCINAGENSSQHGKAGGEARGPMKEVGHTASKQSKEWFWFRNRA